MNAPYRLFSSPRRAHLRLPALAVLSSMAACVLSACGGGSGAADSGVATGTTVLHLTQVSANEAAPAAQNLLPAFHVAAALLDAPDGRDAYDNRASTHHGPHTTYVPDELDGVSSARLSAASMHAVLHRRASAAEVSNTTASGQLTPMASGSAVATYTPAQIRAAYGLPSLPTLGATPTASQAAAMGAGQTVYIVDAYADPNAASELAAFNAKFGLPTCTSLSIASTATLPLASAAKTGCTFSVVYANASGGMNASAPSYNSGWATEIALDVQWVHATAPMARIVLIEATDASMSGLLGAIALANKMGNGVVSMSFGASEGSWTTSEDSYFSATGMSYVAAAGDGGAAVEWPAVSSHVLAVGGTSLSYSGTGTRSEVVWSGTGGGVSSYVATPSYQNSTVPGMGTPARRSVNDVSFNADPSTGQYVVTIAPGSAAQDWLSAGGTSLAAPQWAALLAVTNALRVQAGKAVLQDPHTTIYGQIASTSANYAGAFADVTRGSDGSCASCSAKTGYDLPTGLGTPNVASLLNQLGGASSTASAPTVTAATISGTAGQALSFTVSATSVDTLSFALSNAPSGMAINASGVVTWASPVAGTYAVTVTAKDTVTGLSGQAVYSVVISAPAAPQLSSANVTATAGTAWSYTVVETAPNGVTWSLGSAPAGVSLSTAGVLAWAKPVAGSYAITVSAKDTKTGLIGSATITLTVTAASTSSGGPTVSASPQSGTGGHALSFVIAISDPNASAMSVSISGVPLGMTFTPSGLNLSASWASPVDGSYTLVVQVKDNLGRSVQASIPVTVSH